MTHVQFGGWMFGPACGKKFKQSKPKLTLQTINLYSFHFKFSELWVAKYVSVNYHPRALDVLRLPLALVLKALAAPVRKILPAVFHHLPEG